MCQDVGVQAEPSNVKCRLTVQCTDTPAPVHKAYSNVATKYLAHNIRNEHHLLFKELSTPPSACVPVNLAMLCRRRDLGRAECMNNTLSDTGISSCSCGGEFGLRGISGDSTSAAGDCTAGACVPPDSAALHCHLSGAEAVRTLSSLAMLCNDRAELQSMAVPALTV